MTQLDPILRWLHVITGFLVLGSMIIPMVTKKGGRAHRRAGWVFVISMTIVCVSSAWMCLVAVIGYQGSSVTGRGTMSREFGIFLMVITLLSGNSTYSGIRVLRQKKRTTPNHHYLDLGFPASLGLSSIALGAWGLVEGNIVLIVFGGLGIASSVRDLKMHLGIPTDKRYWWYVHMSHMFNACISALTAFAVINSENLPDSIRSAVPEWFFWIAPSIVLAPILILWRKRYERQFSNNHGAA